MSIRYLTAGESHGKGLVGIIEGVPAGLPINLDELHVQMRRRKLGYGRGARQKIETDEVEILSGVRLGKTLGSPVSLWIKNRDWEVWKEIMSSEPLQGDGVRRQVHVPRPGHADLVGGVKYQHRDLRNVLERASARETAMRVALGSVARKFLSELGICVASRVIQIGTACDDQIFCGDVGQLNLLSDLSVVRCINSSVDALMVEQIEAAKKEGNTLGGVFEVYASGLPIGLGSYSQWDRRLEGRIAQGLMSLNAIKAVEMGLGKKVAQLRGSEVHDEYVPASEGRRGVEYKTNRSGGIEGGMSTGQTLQVRATMKPISTLMKPLSSVDLRTGEASLAHIERSDTCAVPAAAVIAESILALILCDEILIKFGGDSLPEVQSRVYDWKKHQLTL